VQKVIPMLCVSDVDATLEWYASLGFTVAQRHPDIGDIEFAFLTSGGAGLMVQSRGNRPSDRIALWFYTGDVDEMFRRLRERRPPVELLEELYEPFYGGRQFSIIDANGMELVFYQSERA
jgi:uncharacterized glyoxalase superfamily protein PhnB